DRDPAPDEHGDRRTRLPVGHTAERPRRLCHPVLPSRGRPADRLPYAEHPLRPRLRRPRPSVRGPDPPEQEGPPALRRARRAGRPGPREAARRRAPDLASRASPARGAELSRAGRAFVAWPPPDRAATVPRPEG